MKFLQGIIYTAILLSIRTVIGGTVGWWFWNDTWHNWFNAPLIAWSQACGAVFIINVVAGDCRPNQNDQGEAQP